MKKTRINLLTTKQDFYKIERYFSTFRKVLIGFCVILLLVIVGLSVYRVVQSTQISQLNNAKKSLLTELSARQTDEVKLIKLSKKLNFHNEFIRDDARFTPYYELLVRTLSESSQSATLKEFNIDKSRQMSFRLAFGNFDEMVRSFQFIESSEFGKNFEHLDMNNFTGESDASDSVNYELSFEGRFKPLNEAQN